MGEEVCRMWSRHASPKHMQEGFLIINDPLNLWGDNLIHTNLPLSLISCHTTLLPGSNYCLMPSAHHLLSRSNLYSFSHPAVQFSPCYTHLVSTHSIINCTSVKAFNSVYSYDPIQHALVYKPVAKKVHTVQTTMPPEFRIMRQLPDNPLASMPTLPTHLPDFVPGTCFTQEWAEKLDLDSANWLWPNELKLIHWLIRVHEKAFAWDASECGRLNKTFFLPYKIPTIPHTPWSQCNIPILSSTLGEVIRIIKEKIQSGVYELSTVAYQSHWFCIVKKDRKLLHLVHDLQPLNAVTIRDSSLPPFVKQLAESFAGYAVYGMVDLYSGYNQHALHEELCDLTMFGTPLGPHWLTTLPQGHANAVQVYWGDTAFILQDKIPDYTSPFVDDVPIKSVKMQYQRTDSSYETIAQNPGIHHFIWEHCIVINCILQQLENVSVMVSATKFVLAAPTAIIIRHKCTCEGRIPEDSKVQKIHDWPECRTVVTIKFSLGWY